MVLGDAGNIRDVCMYFVVCLDYCLFYIWFMGALAL